MATITHRLAAAVVAVVALCLLVVAGADAAVAPLIGLYEGRDSEGDRIAFTVDPPSNGTQRVRATAAGPYSSICAPVGALVGPLFYATCGDVYPWPIEEQQWIQAKVQLSAVYVDSTADRENQAAFNGTVGATAITGGSEGSAVSHTYPTLNWHAVLVDPAAVVREVGDDARIRDGAAILPLRCTVEGLRSCTGRLLLHGGSAAPIRRTFRIRGGALLKLRVPLRRSLRREVARRGHLGVEVDVISTARLARSVERKSEVTLLPGRSG